MASKNKNEQGRFATIPGPNVPRSVFDRSHGNKLTMDAGYLIPFFVDEALPGDTMSMNVSMFGRIATLLTPIMDNLYLDTHFFFIPYRLVWENWEKFMGAQDNPGDSTSFLIPTKDTIGGGGSGIGSINDYMGIPTGVPNLTHNTLPFRAYNLVFNTWFRDENLVDSLDVPMDDGPDAGTEYAIRKRGKRHDYFTSSLPFAQKGDAVDIPFALSAPVTLTNPQNIGVVSDGSSPSSQFGNLAGLAFPATSAEWTAPTVAANAVWANTGMQVDVGNATGTADLSAASTINVNLLRESITLQQLLEKDARGGTRYTEIVRAHFGVVSPDARLQRPEYLGGGTQPLNVMAVPNTAGDAEVQASLTAYGTVTGSGHGWRKSFTEHGVILGLVSMRADLNYQQGLERMWSRESRYDFFWPTFANLGEQIIKNKEIYAQGSADAVADEEAFGYQERYAEYRYKPNRITGLFRSTALSSLDVWHLAQEFGSLPTLDQTFIEEDPPVDRVIAVPSEPHLLLDTFMRYRCARPIPVNSVPGLKRL